jgi:Spy/CpxP family protein refolding chaperone
MKKSVVFLAIIVIMMMAFTVDSHAAACGTGMGRGAGMCGGCMGMYGERPMMGRGMMMHIQQLGLDDNQTAKFKSIHLKMKRESIQREAQVRIAELELKELLDKDPVDMKAAEAKVRQIESLRAELKILHLRTHEEVKGILTPEQRKKLDTFRDMRMGSGVGMMGGCRMMGNRTGMGLMQQMQGTDMQGSEETEEPDADMPDEGHAH